MAEVALNHLPLVVTALVVGFLIGYIGIGGVLLAPAISIMAGLPIHAAVPLAMFTYVLAGLAGTAIYGLGRSLPWALVAPLLLGVCPGALAGALILSSIPPAVVKGLIAAAILLAGLQTLRPKVQADPWLRVSHINLFAAGTLTGLGSAITGTGGPLILLPILLLVGVELRAGVGLAQLVQIPIGGFATIGNAAALQLDIWLGAVLTPAIVVGVILGASLMHALPAEPVRRSVGTLLLSIGTIYALGLLLGAIATLTR